MLGFMLYRVSTRSIELTDLTDDQRLRLLRQATQVSPPLYEPHFGIPPPGFYHFRPDTLYGREHAEAGSTGVFGDVFTTNELGFRSAPVISNEPGRRRRLVIVGDSWTFGPGVRFDEVFTQQLQRLLDRTGPSWTVINVGMMGWNTANELAALRAFLPALKPDLIVICPTSNDIDDSYEIWNGHLARTGFDSAGIFRNSYEYERRWVETFRSLQEATEFLREQQITSFIYFLAEWRRLAPYYARLAGLTAGYAVVPTPYIESPYRLPVEVDPGQHASVEGHRLIGSYLYNTLLTAGLIGDGQPVPLDHDVEFPGHQFSATEVEQEFESWRGNIRTPELIGGEGEFMRQDAMISLPGHSDATVVVTEFELLDLPSLYPLRVRVDLASPEGVSEERVFKSYSPGPHRVEVTKPRSLSRYDFVEVRVRAVGLIRFSGRVH